jgi:excinuclease UvrABC ATPase subunit
LIISLLFFKYSPVIVPLSNKSSGTPLENDNTLIIIEHHSEIIKQADWIIDIGPDGGVNGGNVVFSLIDVDQLSVRLKQTQTHFV